jgi:hypothetical protein
MRDPVQVAPTAREGISAAAVIPAQRAKAIGSRMDSRIKEAVDLKQCRNKSIMIVVVNRCFVFQVYGEEEEVPILSDPMIITWSSTASGHQSSSL